MRRFRTLTLTISLVTLTIGLVASPVSAATEVVDTRRVSVASDGTQANGWSEAPAISADGSTIAYFSWADDLVPNDTNGLVDVFVYDVATKETTRVSVASDGTQSGGPDGSSVPAISGDGGTIVYHSNATNLVPNDTNNVWDVFAYDVATATTIRVSVASDGTQADSDPWTNPGGPSSSDPAISDDGGTIVYCSEATNLVPNDTNGTADVFAYDVATATTTRVSVASDSTQADGLSFFPAISGDGGTIVYYSDAADLVPNDTNGTADVFAYDVATATTTRVSVASDGTQATGGGSYQPAISGDGGTIVYYSGATNLVADDTNGEVDAFVYNVATAETTRVSVPSDGTQANGPSGAVAMQFDQLVIVHKPAVSSDGGIIAYDSYATNLVADDTNDTWDVFVTVVRTDPSQPTTKEECKHEGWRDFPNLGFRNQGQCIRFVQTGR